MNRCCCFILECGGSTPLFLSVKNLYLIQSAVKPAHSKQLLHRIMSARTKWLASKQAPNCHSASAYGAVSFNCFARIFRTSRNKAARRRQPGRDYCLVKLQKRNQNKPHRWSAAASVARHRFGFTRSELPSSLPKAPSPLRSAGALQKLSACPPPALLAQRSYETRQSEVLLLT